MKNPFWQSVCAFIDRLSLLVVIVLLFRWVFPNYCFCAPSLSQESLSCFWLLYSPYLILISFIFMFYWICHVLFSLSFAYRQFRSHFSLYLENVVFWHGNCRLSFKWSFDLFQAVNLVLMSPNSHVDMFYTHSQSFMHYRTSVITFVAKCICVTLGEVCCIVIALRAWCCSCFFLVINFVS